MKMFFALFIAVMITGCSSLQHKQEPVCSGIANAGGKNTTVHIYGVRKISNQTQYRAGYPFNWQWVGKESFKTTTCQ
ncbi:cor protein [Mixta calida]|uniref:phage exclusion lipoprotein Cor n=1 Tax=Mixta calida TaxID=665913 RepID=UPI00290F54A2|nr:cor protein [Mixta calida]MDU6539172.1 cor protein [Mixta calida]